ncbi:hypothetical protein M758_11G166400 [Ceratodon purpureus]|nr:hypothetical protein M758_11G166400 [Ceratodon purpureus]
MQINSNFIVHILIGCILAVYTTSTLEYTTVDTPIQIDSVLKGSLETKFPVVCTDVD